MGWADWQSNRSRVLLFFFLGWTWPSHFRWAETGPAQARGNYSPLVPCMQNKLSFYMQENKREGGR
jgi:hypothetical protein